MAEIVAVIIPSFNEKKTMGELLEKIRKEQKNAFIVLVDDNSPDGTKKIIENAQKNDKRIFLLSRKGKNGRGSAVIDGIRYALDTLHATIFIEMDADLLHNPKDIKRLIEKSKPNTVVIASRYIKGGKALNITFRRKIMSAVANKMIHFILQLPLVDNTNGFRCYPKNAVKELINHRFTHGGYITLSESAYLLYKKGFTFEEIPVICINRKEKRSNASLKEFFDALQSLVKIRAHIQ